MAEVLKELKISDLPDFPLYLKAIESLLRANDKKSIDELAQKAKFKVRSYLGDAVVFGNEAIGSQVTYQKGKHLSLTSQLLRENDSCILAFPSVLDPSGNVIVPAYVFPAKK
jgi:hypothetical protein